jgi:outer membrane protein assembly factor BamB
MTPVRGACSLALACAFAVAGLVGCSTSYGHVGPTPCCAPTRAYALELTSAGRVRWQVPLGLAGSRPQVSPLAVGAVAVFAHGDFLYGLRLADGHRVWSRTASQDIGAIWRWRNLVIVLTDPGSAGLSLTLLTGLDASTGHARWTLSIAADVQASYPIADGGLAILRSDDTLEVVDLSTGRVRWTRPAGYPPDSGQVYPPTMAAADGAVLFVVNGELTSYDDRTGQIRWTDTLQAILMGAAVGELGLVASAGLVYLTGAQLLPGWHPAPLLLGISAADGRVKWRLAASPRETLWVYAAGLMYFTSSSGGVWQEELDPATGRVRWRTASAYDAIATPAGVVTAPGPGSTDQISLHDPATGQTRWIASLAGLNGGWQQQPPVLPDFPAGPLLVVPAAGPHGSDLLAAFRMSDGHRAWQVTIPEPLAGAPQSVRGGMLVYLAGYQLPP